MFILSPVYIRSWKFYWFLIIYCHEILARTSHVQICSKTILNSVTRPGVSVTILLCFSYLPTRVCIITLEATQTNHKSITQRFYVYVTQLRSIISRFIKNMIASKIKVVRVNNCFRKEYFCIETSGKQVITAYSREFISLPGIHASWDAFRPRRLWELRVSGIRYFRYRCVDSLLSHPTVCDM